MPSEETWIALQSGGEQLLFFASLVFLGLYFCLWLLVYSSAMSEGVQKKLSKIQNERVSATGDSKLHFWRVLFIHQCPFMKFED